MKDLLTKEKTLYYSILFELSKVSIETTYNLFKRLLPIFVVATLGCTILTFTQTGFNVDTALINIIWMLLIWIYKSIRKIYFNLKEVAYNEIY